MFGLEGFFDLGSMDLISKNDINDVLGVFGRVWGCLDSMDLLMLDEDVDVDVW